MTFVVWLKAVSWNGTRMVPMLVQALTHPIVKQVEKTAVPTSAKLFGLQIGHAVNVSVEDPENAHKIWVKEQGVCTNQRPHVQLSMMLHSLYKGASSLLCEGAQGNLQYFSRNTYINRACLLSR